MLFFSQNISKIIPKFKRITLHLKIEDHKKIDENKTSGPGNTME
jgi:hypothetical protein